MRDSSRRPLATRRDRRELLGIDPLDVGFESAGFDVQGLLGLEFQINPFIRRQSGNDIGQKSGRDGHGSVGIDLAGYPVGHPDLEVGGSQLQTAVFRPEQDVVQDR